MKDSWKVGFMKGIAHYKRREGASNLWNTVSRCPFIGQRFVCLQRQGQSPSQILLRCNISASQLIE